MDDSGFVGWLASRVKSATGAGLFVICGQNRDRGGVFDYYGVPSAAADAVRALLDRLGDTGSLDGTVMQVVRAAPNARIGPETLFCFDVDGSALTARYGGGAVAEGWLVGTLDPASATAQFRYLQVGIDGTTIDSGESTAEFTRLPSGRWQMTEHFTWASKTGTGTNQLEQPESLTGER